MKLYAKQGHIILAIDLRTPSAGEELIKLRYMVNQMFTAQAGKMDELIEEWKSDRTTKN